MRKQRESLRAKERVLLSSLIVVSYVTGSTQGYFAGALAKANANIEIIKNSSFSSHIERYVAVANDGAAGYRKGNYYNMLVSSTEGCLLNWSERENLSKLIS